jgi:hypothetical protein
MFAFLAKLLLVVQSRLKSRASLEAENLVLRQQVIVLSRKSRSRVRLRNIDRLIFVWLYRCFPAILNAITVVKPETVIWWHRRCVRAYWRWKSRRRDSRPRWRVRSSVHLPYSCHGDPRPPYRTALAVAERPRRTAHRIDTARITRPPHRVRRNRTCAVSWGLTLRTTMRSGPISLWIKMLRTFGGRRSSVASQRNYPRRAPSSIRPGLGFG